jgi:hypothetical protein
MIKLLSTAEQLRLYSDTAYQVSHLPTEQARFGIIADSLRAFGFGGADRWRVGQLVEDGKALAFRYGEGNYGTIGVSDIKYSIEGSVTGSVVGQGDPFLSSQGAMAFLVMPLMKAGKPVGVLTLDSPDLNAFSNEFVQAIDVYKFLIAGSLDAPASTTETDLVPLIAKLRKQQVLILGKDTGEELQLLTVACDELAKLGYKPILVKHEPDIPEMSNEEKVRVLADTSKFVLLENSYAAGQIAELKMCSTNRIITACLREAGKGSSWMVTDYSKDYDFIKEFEYKSQGESFLLAIQSAVAWAENLVEQRIAYYDSKYPWRSRQ